MSRMPIFPTQLFTENADSCQGLDQLRARLGIGPGKAAPMPVALPFTGGDLTAGSEHELQVVVEGRRENVDLAITIAESNFYRNVQRRIETGEAPRRVFTDLLAFMEERADGVWDNSWVRFPRNLLAPYAREVLHHDLKADKSRPESPLREDAHRFLFQQEGESWLRVPVSYLLKLGLADVLGRAEASPASVRETGERLLAHFLSDNTSPETLSFYIVGGPGRIGRDLSRESAKRFLLTQLLAAYTNRAFRLLDLGQRAIVCFAPNPPLGQKVLNDRISDAFYRELFMSPCLSGWDRGEEKHQYMGLCHQTLSRSQLNAVIKLREAGIITTNLVVLPNISNVSLANNGVHISIGSRKLTALLADRSSGYGGVLEKHYGDLVIKIVEHFLPLFVGTCSAAPYRLGFTDFHPEKVLGFLPHELHATHLRMFWRRWRKKAKLKVFGQPVTPFGPSWADRMVSRLFKLRGDFIPDHRLIDYLVTLPSTAQCPALDGTPGNAERLKADLATMGIFDPRMATYLLFRMREYHRMGFTGFEGRFYSLFPTFADMAQAADLQALLTAFAWQLILSGEITHQDIPDDPFTESERRQPVFAAAIDLPTFFVRHDTGNRFIKTILQHTGRTRPSQRYGEYVRVRTDDYRRALLDFLRRKGAALVEREGLSDTLRAFDAHLDANGGSATERLTSGILEKGGGGTPLGMRAEDFNRAAERYYREDLRRLHLEEALAILAEDFSTADRDEEGACRQAHSAAALTGEDHSGFIARHRKALLADEAGVDTLRAMICLVLLSLENKAC